MKHTRTTISEGVTCVRNAATGETIHPSFCRSQFATNEALYKAKAEYFELYSMTLDKSFTDEEAKLPGVMKNMHLIKEMAAKIKAEIEGNNDETICVVI